MGAPLSVEISTPDGNLFQFTRASTTTDAWSTESNSGTLTILSSGAWTWHRSVGEENLNFDAAGRLQTKVERNGWTTSYTYNAAGQVASITNAFGRTLVLGYSGAGQLATLTTPDSRVFAYAYDGTGRLSTVTYPDTKLRTFVYENSAFPQALTGIFDEAGNRWGTFSYDGAGRAVGSVLAGNVEQYQVVYAVPSTTVVDPLGTSRKYNYSNNDGVTNATLPSATGQDDAQTRLYEYTTGLPTQELDFKNVRIETTWDVARRLRLKLIRGANTTELQTITTQWHPTFSLPTLITEAERTTAYSYDTSGNRLTETVTHTGGNPKVQTRSWTYTTQGLIATETASNGGVTSYTYDARGNVLTETNPLGYVTTYTYDSANRVLSQRDPNGLMTTNTWDARDRLLTQAVGGMATTLTYKPYGAVETVTLPTGLVLAYTHDAAHRLTGWSNNRGESGTYTLDGMGNRTAEQIKDGAGNVAWTMVRTISNINRVSAKTEGSNLTSTFGYDANGELTSTTNGLNQTTHYGLDGLRRVAAVTDAANASASFKFNALDAITQTKDFRGVITSYVRDAQGNARSETSADLGWITTEYDNLGLPSQIKNSIGRSITITRDLLGRPTNLLFIGGKTTTLRYDLADNSKGYLSEVIDRSGTTEYVRDAFGRVTLKKQTLVSGSVQQVSYAYNPNGTLASIGYPNNGGVLTHTYDSTGRLVGLSLNGNPLVTGISWNPLGQPTAWTWALASPAVSASRVYDTAGRLTATEFSSYIYDAAGRISGLTQNLYQPGDTDPTHSTIASTNVTWSVGYNAVGRIVSFNSADKTTEFAYDANGSRSSSSRSQGGQITNRTYTIGDTSNRLTGFTQTINGASTTSVAYGYNAIGDLLSDGLRSYTYDAEGRLATATTGATDVSPTTRYAHNALGQRVFKTEPLYPPMQGDESDPGFMQSLIAFFKKLWSPTTTQAELLGSVFVYDEQGTLLSEMSTGGNSGVGSAQYVYLPTSNGPMPIAALINGSAYAVHSDHLNTPRKLTNASGQAVWQWSYGAFGEDNPTLAKSRFANLDATPIPGTTSISEVKFNLRYPGQYADEESGLFYNGFRSYSPAGGFYTQNDPIGLEGGPNRRIYAEANPLNSIDPMGLQVPLPPPPMPLPGVPNPVLEGNKQLADRLSRALEGDREQREKTYQTYTRWHPQKRLCYSGTSGYDDPQTNVRSRGLQQAALNTEGFNPPVLDKSSVSYGAIRGREQALIETNGGARRSGGTSRNEINGIGPANIINGPIYRWQGEQEFGFPVPIGNCQCQ